MRKLISSVLFVLTFMPQLGGVGFIRRTWNVSVKSWWYSVRSFVAGLGIRTGPNSAYCSKCGSRIFGEYEDVSDFVDSHAVCFIGGISDE